MVLDKQFIYRGLLQYNYFPSQKEYKEELPPVISTKKLTPEVSEKLVKLSSRKGGYDQVEYKISRFNNVPRCLSIPHPLPYTKLCHSIYDNWDKLKYITKTKNSLIIPKEHSDNRIIVMDYESSEAENERHIELSFNKKFYVNTDISNFYPSIYSHSIPWALVGFKKAKKEKDPIKWFNKIDKNQRLTKRDETNGVPIGPASSNIVSESILARVDKILNDENFDFIRYIDDYCGYFDSYKKSEKFILRLSEELSNYKLVLNIRKTIIERLPIPKSPDWISDLTTRIPDKDNIKPIELIRFMDYALNKQSITPDGSVLKFATKCIIENVKDNTAELLLRYLLNLCIRFPILLPFLDILFQKIELGKRFKYDNQLLHILLEHTINKRSDAMSWSLYYLNNFFISIPEEIASNIIESKDCISILFLYLSGNYDNEVKAFFDSLDRSDLFLLDQYWLLIYQLFYDDKISNPYQDKKAYINHCKRGRDRPEYAMKREIKVFETLKNENVSFVESEK